MPKWAKKKIPGKPHSQSHWDQLRWEGYRKSFTDEDITRKSGWWGREDKKNDAWISLSHVQTPYLHPVQTKKLLLIGTIHTIFLQDPGMNASYWFWEPQELSSYVCCVQATAAALKKTWVFLYYATDSSLISIEGAFMWCAQLPQSTRQLQAKLHNSLTVLWNG